MTSRTIFVVVVVIIICCVDLVIEEGLGHFLARCSTGGQRLFLFRFQSFADLFTREEKQTKKSPCQIFVAY